MSKMRKTNEYESAADATFVEDEDRNAAAKRYEQFMKGQMGKQITKDRYRFPLI